ncbi:putative phage tail assembly chaperone [Gallibacterium anatis]|uniref:putative phage tail assembly chaperone n=1 Tax=Gallibacterium anatis TaxID=750 RepID=UPI0039FD871A
MKTKTAQQLLEELTGKERVTVNIGGVELVFNRDNAAIDALFNEITKENKITPVKDYLLQIVDGESKADLLTIINVPGLAVQLVEKLNAIFVPEIEIAVKN